VIHSLYKSVPFNTRSCRSTDPISTSIYSTISIARGELIRSNLELPKNSDYADYNLELKFTYIMYYNIQIVLILTVCNIVLKYICTIDNSRNEVKG